MSIPGGGATLFGLGRGAAGEPTEALDEIAALVEVPSGRVPGGRLGEARSIKVRIKRETNEER